MDLNKKLITLLCSIAVLAVLIVTTYVNAFKNNKFTCSRYILNTYLYILLAFIFITVMVLGLEYKNVDLRMTGWQFLGVFLITLGVLVVLMLTPVKHLIAKHILWLLFVLLIGIIMYPMLRNTKNKNTIYSALLTTIALVVILSAIAFWKPEWISLSWGPVLFVLLLAGIILELLSIFVFGTHRDTSSYIFKGFMYFFIVLFMFYVLYDTKLLQVRAKMCKVADYLNESLNLFLDIVNIFVRILALGR